MSRQSAGSDQGAIPWAPQGGLIRRTIETGARLLGVGAPAPPPPGGTPLPGPQAAPDPTQPDPPPPPRPCHRRAWGDRLWGEGMVLPGGAPEILRLAALLPLSAETTLLLAGNGATAAGAVVAGARGSFVAAFDQGGAPPPRPGARNRVTAEALDPEAPAFRARYHHHALLLEPLRAGGSPDALLAAAAAGLRPGGQMVMLDLVARGERAGAVEARWLAAERRHGPPAEDALPTALRRAGFDVHVVEDAGRRHAEAVMAGWQALLQALGVQPARPSAAEAADLVFEAEAWLLRLRLLQDGRLRLLRWHASLAR
ncbi:hypothetical protein [Roseomonas sp. CECT 9278]|uniref:hypothetical protein n=1 Tax=Roseomonas sp. CECT 9278 TaxID=2845823 RepID=UPI001E31F9A1|nr:hypothetical protein [Roseomonas sp. CECT 9278]CAH0216695.1 hypothetical protein ROS9278_02302 [Roseomonas sp. CECT 9278]